MIYGKKTASESRIDTVISNAIVSDPSVNKVMGYLDLLMGLQERNPTEYSFNGSIKMPLIAAQKINEIWGYDLTYTNTTPPQGFSGQWVEVTKIDWSGQAIGETRRAVLKADTVNSTVNLTDSGLEFNVKANESYYFKAFIPYSSAATTTGSRWVIDGSTAVMSVRSSYPLTATTHTTNFVSAYNQPAAANASSLTVNSAVIEGVITPSVTGIVKVRFASEVAGSAITARAGSFIEWVRNL